MRLKEHWCLMPLLQYFINIVEINFIGRVILRRLEKLPQVTVKFFTKGCVKYNLATDKVQLTNADL